MHLNSPDRFGPWKIPHVVLQPEEALAPCLQACDAAQAHCICEVAVGQVEQAVVTLLSQAGGPVARVSSSEYPQYAC
jgi:hypothetical protein